MGEKMCKDDYIVLMRKHFNSVKSILGLNCQRLQGFTNKDVDDLTYQELEYVNDMYYEILNSIQENAKEKQEFKRPIVENKFSKKGRFGMGNISSKNMIGS